MVTSETEFRLQAEADEAAAREWAWIQSDGLRRREDAERELKDLVAQQGESCLQS